VDERGAAFVPGRSAATPHVEHPEKEEEKIEPKKLGIQALEIFKPPRDPTFSDFTLFIYIYINIKERKNSGTHKRAV
jgi:hypothetical protein